MDRGVSLKKRTTTIKIQNTSAPPKCIFITLCSPDNFYFNKGILNEFYDKWFDMLTELFSIATN